MSEVNKLASWLEKQYIDWMAKEKQVKSQREFAELLGIDPVKLNQYLNGRRKMPDLETVNLIAEKLGPEIYDILGLARPDPQLQALTHKWHTLDQATKDKILEIAEPGQPYNTDIGGD